MKCENNFCIYEENGECRLEEITIDGAEMCMDCMHPNIDEGYLKMQKQKLLERFRLEREMYGA